MPNTPLIIVDSTVCGRTSDEKIRDLRKKMDEKSAKWLVVTALDEVACELFLLDNLL